jgi:hypothetical protein
MDFSIRRRSSSWQAAPRVCVAALARQKRVELSKPENAEALLGLKENTPARWCLYSVVLLRLRLAAYSIVEPSTFQRLSIYCLPR